MDLPKVVIKENYDDYLKGKEVEAAFIHPSTDPVWPGERVLAFKNSLAATSNITLPKFQQSHYIGIEGTVTDVKNNHATTATEKTTIVKVKKL